jgi:hypothetical protein
MLAEMFMLRLQSLLRASEPSERLPSTIALFVPITTKRS